ncbi:MAG: HpcH/HpaI aldolase family protein [Janthinobacterium lividum]
MANKIKELWAQGKPALNGWLAIPNAFTAEVMAQGGFDSLTVDLQHGIQDYMSMVACFQGIQGMANPPVLPMVRVPWNEPGIIGKVVDAGAYGVICPMVNTKAEAEALVSFMRYPPMGKRSNGPIRAGIYGVYGSAGTYQATANDEVLCIPMIETQEAIDNLDAILDVPGIDCVYIGPSDLAFSRGGTPVLDQEGKEALDTYEQVLKATQKQGVRAGIHCGKPEYAVRMIKMGFNLVTIANDSALVLTGAQASVKAVRGGI